jgi:hypothetical protein
MPPRRCNTPKNGSSAYREPSPQRPLRAGTWRPSDCVRRPRKWILHRACATRGEPAHALGMSTCVWPHQCLGGLPHQLLAGSSAWWRSARSASSTHPTSLRTVSSAARSEIVASKPVSARSGTGSLERYQDPDGVLGYDGCIWLGAMPAQGFVPFEVVAVAASHAAMVLAQAG